MLRTETAALPVEAKDVLDVLPRRIGEAGPSGGPTLVCVGSLHGNEPPGALALQRLLPRLAADPRGLRGRLVGLLGNRVAFARGQRYLDADLNRIWQAERLARVRAGVDPRVAEEAELRELSEVLDRELERDPFARFLDLHSTSGDGPAFTTLDDTLANRVLAFALPVPHVLGLEEELSGTMIGHLNERRVPAIGFEAGQHVDPLSIERAEAAVWVTMETCGLLEPGAREEVAAARRLLEREGRARPEVIEVRHRHAVVAGDGFSMLEGFESFQPVQAGQVLAADATGPIAAREDGLILMPLYQEQGSDGFFVVRRVNPIWLAVSAWVRKLRMDRFVHWLPGVRRSAEEHGVFLVDRSLARWFALQVFHLLGFRRRSIEGPTLEMVRRDGGRRSAPGAR
jgi:succinylglutamate desuccinylase